MGNCTAANEALPAAKLKMRILINALFTIPSAQTGAIRTVTDALLVYLAKLARLQGHKAFILASRSNETHWRNLCSDAETVIVPFAAANRSVRVMMEQAACQWGVRRVDADVFYSSSGALPRVPLSCASVVYFQNLLIFHLNEFYKPAALGMSRARWIGWRMWEQYTRWAFANSMRNSTEVIAVSQRMADEAQQYCSVKRKKDIHVVPCGVNDAFRVGAAKANLPRPYTGDYIISVSDLMPHKNFEACLRIFATLKRRHHVPHTLVIVGAGRAPYVHSLHALAADLKITDYVMFSGHVPHDTLPAWYAHASAFILASACESFGLPVIEAMAAGTPVVVSNLSGLPETVGSAGVVCDPSNFDAFADELYRVLTDDVLRKTLLQRGLNRSSAFAWDSTARDTLDVMRVACERFYNRDRRQTFSAAAD
jgi:glycosyltransferase involved in cell wall biosynthesis